MAVRIRLRRVGRKKQASFRIVVADKSAPRDGTYVESLGYYNPRRQPAELRLDLERVDHWLGHGAEPSPTAASLIRKARKGGDDKVGLYRVEDVAAAAKEEALRAAHRGRARETPADEPTPETAAKADPEVMAQTHARVEEPTAEPLGEAAETRAPSDEAEAAAEGAAAPEAEAATESPAAEATALEEAPASEEAEPSPEAKPGRKSARAKKAAAAEAGPEAEEATEE